MSNFKILSGLALSSDAHPPETFCWKKAEENNNNIFTDRHIISLKIIVTGYLFSILISEPDTKFTEHKHTLSAQTDW